VDANGVEQLLVEQFGEFLGSVDSVDENDGLVESQ
jgi:hypothetical protein